jgi:hypothetical protein
MTKSLNLKYLVIWVRSSIITKAERKKLLFLMQKDIFNFKKIAILDFQKYNAKINDHY